MIEPCGPWLNVVGIGEDGFDGLSPLASQAIRAAKVLVGSTRQLNMIPPSDQERITLPSPLTDLFPQLLARRGEAVCVLASGDPMTYGIGATLSRIVQHGEMKVYSGASSFALAAARLGWPLQETTCLTVHGRPLSLVQPHIHPKARLIVLSENGTTPAHLARLLVTRGFGRSVLHVFEHMGGPREQSQSAIAESWAIDRVADLNTVAIDCAAGDDAQRFSTLAGLPDDAYRHDGQITKRDIRAVTLARLAPSPGELLWDVGAGCGSIGIEWMRTHPACRAIAVEANAGRQEMIAFNKEALGVPGLVIVAGKAPEALEGLERPDAVFIGGGVTIPGVLDRCWSALKPGGRLVANAVTVQSEVALAQWKERVGGELTRISIGHAEPLGRFDTWRGMLPVTIFSAQKVSA